MVVFLSSDNFGSGSLSKVTSSKLKKLIQPTLIQLVGRTLLLDNDGTLSSENGGMGHLSKVASNKVKKLIQPFFIQLVGHTLHSE